MTNSIFFIFLPDSWEESSSAHRKRGINILSNQIILPCWYYREKFFLNALSRTDEKRFLVSNIHVEMALHELMLKRSGLLWVYIVNIMPILGGFKIQAYELELRTELDGNNLWLTGRWSKLQYSKEAMSQILYASSKKSTVSPGFLCFKLGEKEAL